VIFHGFKNCIRSYVSDEGKRCRIPGKVRPGYDVAAQVERSGTSSIVVVPEIAYDEPSSDPGVLGERGGLRAFLTELVEKALAPAIGPRRFDEIERVALIASSGGYQALLPALAHGDVEAVRDVYLLDAMYVAGPSLDGFVRDRIGDFRPDAASGRRFGMIFCQKGSGTSRESRELGSRVAGWMESAGQGAWASFAPSLPDADVDDLRAPVVIVGTPLMHDKIVERYLWRFLAASGI
jgi:hypothetical protein